MAARNCRTCRTCRTCRYCQRPLSPLEALQGDSCRQLGCQQRAVQARQQAALEADLSARRHAAAQALANAAPLHAHAVALPKHTTRLVRTSALQRREQLAFLTQLANTEPAAETAADAAAASAATPAAPTPALAQQVCAFCRGRCCRHGAFHHAFINGELLQRWVHAHPGSTRQDAAAAYAQHLPQQHVEASCLHHGRDGCTLPREMRSDICKHHACDGLIEARQHLGAEAAGAAHGLVLSMSAGARVQRAVWLSEAGAHVLRRRPRA